MLHNILTSIFSQRTLVFVLLLLQAGLLLFMVLTTSQNSEFINWTLTLISLLVVLSIFNKKTKPAFKLSWVFLILFFPVFGGLLYLIFNFQSSTRKAKRRIEEIQKQTQEYFAPEEDYLPILLENQDDYTALARYLQDYAKFPVYQHSPTEYLTPGEVKFERLLSELKEAQHYIFLEYFIIEEGIMWNAILSILQEKVKQGVLVRVIYDDMGCMLKLPRNYHKTLKKYGIECIVFNPFRPIMSTLQNNRDHRKIVVIDGKTAFTGGINLADEYINAYEKLGHWKDASIMVKGPAAWSFTLIFLQMWRLINSTDEDFMQFKPDCSHLPSDGFVQPYADSPMDTEHVGEHVYMHILNNARRYVYINTPYLIIDDTLVSALALAAKSGVDVRIVTPHLPDKKLVHMTTRSYYRDLITAGVKIYEYTDGFIHSKTFVSDDKIATVGTTNLDFRSLYLHFECGVCLYNTSSIQAIKQDFLETLDRCHEISLSDIKNTAPHRFVQECLRIFAPMM